MFLTLFNENILMNRKELVDLTVAYLTISAAFAIVLDRGFFTAGSISGGFALALFVSFLAVGTGFILHELAHRQVAKHFGAHAEFRAWPFGLIIAIAVPIITLGNFLFAAPGAVYIYGENIDRRQNGLISVAGPATNIAAGLFFGFLSFVSANPFVVAIAYPAMFINFWLAFFNLIPVPPLDGSKVFAWNPIIWIALFIPLILFIFI